MGDVPTFLQATGSSPRWSCLRTSISLCPFFASYFWFFGYDLPYSSSAVYLTTVGKRVCCARFRVMCDDSDWIRHLTQMFVAERHFIRIRMVPDNDDRVKVIVRWIQTGRILVYLHTDPFRHVNVHKLPFTTENWKLWKGINKSPNWPVTQLSKQGLLRTCETF